ncbi:chemotaxis protein MotB [Lentibacillus halodurans]|uniref:Chemotaxis protein MotB n=1 Tax=Lentibacillus halodurans TaxID=237679 RepID=A0A1I1AD58_9BACI|nr:flagellar motor protein MotB [Lentibacillus halodurans]SFB35917.1 chemotaxis protein MotB [Lentibacillus halodurans]
MRRKRQRKGNHINESWLLPYSDLLTLLVALFIVLFAMSEIDAQKYESLIQVFDSEFNGGSGILEGSNGTQDQVPVEADHSNEDDNEHDQELDKMNELQKLKGLQQQINEYIEQNDLSEVLGTKLSNEGLFVTISNDVSFDTGSAEVKKEGRKLAREISNFLYTDPPNQIVVSGHTDNRPIENSDFSSNWDLSAMRAINFMQLLLEHENLEPEQFSAKGFGEHHPIVPNTNEQNMEINRRVEVQIMPNHVIETGESSSDEE